MKIDQIYNFHIQQSESHNEHLGNISERLNNIEARLSKHHIEYYNDK